MTRAPAAIEPRPRGVPLIPESFDLDRGPRPLTREQMNLAAANAVGPTQRETRDEVLAEVAWRSHLRQEVYTRFGRFPLAHSLHDIEAHAIHVGSVVIGYPFPTDHDVVTFDHPDSDSFTMSGTIRTGPIVFHSNYVGPASAAEALSTMQARIDAARESMNTFQARMAEWLEILTTRFSGEMIHVALITADSVQSGEGLYADPWAVYRGEHMPDGDLPPTGEGDPLEEVRGLSYRQTMDEIDEVLNDG